MSIVREIIDLINKNQGIVTFCLMVITWWYVRLTKQMLGLQKLKHKAKIIIYFESTDINQLKANLVLENIGDSPAYNIIIEKGETKSISIENTPENELLFGTLCPRIYPGDTLKIPIIFNDIERKKGDYLIKYKYKSMGSKFYKKGKF